MYLFIDAFLTSIRLSVNVLFKLMHSVNIEQMQWGRKVNVVLELTARGAVVVK